MPEKLEVSFNSPQCGWMSIGFADGQAEFHTTTAHAPYRGALGDLMVLLTEMLTSPEEPFERTLKWNRDPEEFDFTFVREADKAMIRIYQYPSMRRETSEREVVFTHVDLVANVIDAFAATFAQLFADRHTDEFEFNWREPFPLAEYDAFTSVANRVL